MATCHSQCIDVLKRFLGRIVHRSLIRALDVATGDGRLSTSLLMRSYKKVDMFDQCPVGLGKAKCSTVGNPALGNIQLSSMQNYAWPFFYSAIFMVWASGYLDRAELVAFLKKAKTKLIVDEGRISRNRTPESFIFLFDNILEEGEEARVVKG